MKKKLTKQTARKKKDNIRMAKTMNAHSTPLLMNEIISETALPLDTRKAAKKVDEFNARMDELATEMAVYFNERVTPGDLAEWNTSMFEICLSFPTKIPDKNDPDSLCFLYSVGWDVLPALIKASPHERVATLKERLIWLYECESYQWTKEALCEINNRLSRSMKKYGVENGDRIYQLMTICAVFQYALNCYQEYALLKNVCSIYEPLISAA